MVLKTMNWKLLITALILACFITNAQKLDDSVLPDQGRVGIATESKDTLYLLDCPMGYRIKHNWSFLTKEQIRVDGIEKPPVFVMVDSIEGFAKLIARIKSEDISTSLNIK